MKHIPDTVIYVFFYNKFELQNGEAKNDVWLFLFVLTFTCCLKSFVSTWHERPEVKLSIGFTKAVLFLDLVNSNAISYSPINI
jgi:hypothetical protein